MFSEFVKDCRNHYIIPAEAFSHHLVKRGLREADGSGVMAGITKKGNAHGYIISEGERSPIKGQLIYCGYNVEELIGGVIKENRFGFEESAYILLFGHLPTQEKLQKFDSILDACRHLPPRFTEDIIMKAPTPSLMNKIATSVLALYAYDDNPDDISLDNLLRQSMELMARIPVIAAHAYSVYSNVFHGKSLTLHNPHENLSTAQNFLCVLRPDKTFTDEEAKLLDLCLILHAEHGGGNNSTFTCRVVSSTATDTYSAISAAIGSLKGPRHGGANIKVQEMFECMKKGIKDYNDDDEILAFLRAILRGEECDGSGLIYGMGHAVYTISDPRAVLLKDRARKLAEEKGYSEDFKLLEAVERLTPAAFAAERGIYRNICANVDLYSGLVYQMLDIPIELYTPLFAIARIAGWCAHRIEECYTSNKIIRPAYKCIARPKEYIPLKDRV
ncbi:MAG: citrate synthase [Clostridiales bacterium]|nr:citrate synthase [Clostridiales bacterium]